MKCIQCGTTMTVKRENVPYKALPGTVLVGVEVSRCPRCGEYEVAIPAIDELNRVLAKAVIESEYRLAGGEVRFLRSYLGYSGADFAKLIGTTPATVSRWENDVQPIGQSSDRLLRALVLLDKRVDAYPISKLAEIRDELPAKPQARRFAPSAKKWKPAGARA
ncbi:MAG TPA: type II TA system antitoxin MqsA family protein [Kofleriaceae bacterium]|nr:type II TA system antitoxin MqsA family protein [Kofleriaceae bacterium]